jgi:hypothetical protein
MTSLKQGFVKGVAAAGMIFAGTAGAAAHSPTALSDKQLDGVTAGGAVIVLSSADAAAIGALALAATVGSTFAGQQASPYPGQPELGPASGVAEGTALAVGTNLGMSGQPPASTATGVTTAGSANGNLVINSTINRTFTGAGGVTFQAGWTFVYGAWVGL